MAPHVTVRWVGGALRTGSTRSCCMQTWTRVPTSWGQHPNQSSHKVSQHPAGVDWGLVPAGQQAWDAVQQELPWPWGEQQLVPSSSQQYPDRRHGWRCLCLLATLELSRSGAE